MAKNRFNIAVIAGDGIGTEVMPEGLRSLSAAAARFDINLHFDHFDFASYDYYARHGDNVPQIEKTMKGTRCISYRGPARAPQSAINDIEDDGFSRSHWSKSNSMGLAAQP